MKNSGRIFLVDDDVLITAMLSRILKAEGYSVKSETNPNASIVERIKSFSPDIVMLDVKMPIINGIDILKSLMLDEEVSPCVIMLTSDDTADTAVRCMKLGATDYITKPFSIDEVRIVVNNLIASQKLKYEISVLRNLHADFLNEDILGNSTGIEHVKQILKKISTAKVPGVLITGESGTGKELVAKTLHKNIQIILNDFKHSPFIPVNCTAIPEHLLESELFGHIRGAFTDAKTDKKGLFELANGGTILLDEIGDMSLSLQSKILRTLEERSIRKVGGTEEIAIDVLVIATTNCNLAELVESGKFRKDLFYRLNTFSIEIPPLRERKEDIKPLSLHFIKHFAIKYNNQNLKKISDDAIEILKNYQWPGNVRELKNIIERIVVLERNCEEICPQHLPIELLHSKIVNTSSKSVFFELPDSGISLEALEKDLIRQALHKTNFNKTHAAKLLNMTYDSFRYQIKKFGFE